MYIFKSATGHLGTAFVFSRYKGNNVSHQRPALSLKGSHFRYSLVSSFAVVDLANLHGADAEVLGVGADNAEGVGVAHAALPALDNDDGVANSQGLHLESLGNGPLDAEIDVLLPVDLGEVGLVLGEQEGVDTTVQVSKARGRGVASHHEDGADRAVLGQ